jgi:translation initiation factor 3 subunit D
MTVEDQSKPKFILPKITDNVNGWGPLENDVPDSLVDIPYTPFSKSERIGKIADWTTSQDYGNDKRKNYQRNDQIYGSGLSNAFNYRFAAEEEASFSLVDRAASSSKKTTGHRTVQKQNRQSSKLVRNFRVPYQQNYRNKAGRRFNRQDVKLLDEGVKIGDQWKVIEDIDMNKLALNTFTVNDPSDISVYGTLNYFDQSVDRISAKSGVALKAAKRIIDNPSTADDEVIQSIAKSTTGRAVFATDSIISTLMCAPRSVYAWDIVITKCGDQIFFDKRDDSQAFDYYTVNENVTDNSIDASDIINSPAQLSEETTSNCKCFAEQAVDKETKYQFKEAYPFNDEDSNDEIGSVAFRYRKWALNSSGEEPISLIVRTTLDAALQQKSNLISNKVKSMEPVESTNSLDDTLFINLRTVDEFDLYRNTSWRKNLDMQKVGCITSEFRSNFNKLSKWAIESILSGADYIKFGFISRVNNKDNKKHEILGTHTFKPKEFANHLQLTIENSWGILKEIVDKLMKLEDGKFVLVKDAVKNTFTLYSVPDNAFDESDNEDEDSS